MKASSKTILFTKVQHGGKTTEMPIAVFPDENACRPLAVAIMTAHKAGEVETLRQLGAGHLVNDEGRVAPNLRFARVTVPYSPDYSAASEDPFADASSAAA